MLHIWHEDSINSSTTQFWNFMKQNSLLPSNTDIRGFSSNNGLLKHVKTANINVEDQYIILMDTVSDNADIKNKYTKLLKYTRNQNNIFISKLLCFEYMILKFNDLESWLQPFNNNKRFDEIINVRNEFIYIKDNGYAWYSSKCLCKYVASKYGINNKDDFKKFVLSYSSENLCFDILNDITNIAGRNFIINKTILGSCWTDYCCSYMNNNLSKAKRLCNIARYRKNSYTKAVNLWNETPAKRIINCKY